MPKDSKRLKQKENGNHHINVVILSCISIIIIVAIVHVNLCELYSCSWNTFCGNIFTKEQKYIYKLPTNSWNFNNHSHYNSNKIGHSLDRIFKFKSSFVFALTNTLNLYLNVARCAMNWNEIVKIVWKNSST